MGRQSIANDKTDARQASPCQSDGPCVSNFLRAIESETIVQQPLHAQERVDEQAEPNQRRLMGEQQIAEEHQAWGQGGQRSREQPDAVAGKLSSDQKDGHADDCRCEPVCKVRLSEHQKRSNPQAGAREVAAGETCLRSERASGRTSEPPSGGWETTVFRPQTFQPETGS